LSINLQVYCAQQRLSLRAVKPPSGPSGDIGLRPTLRSLRSLASLTRLLMANATRSYSRKRYMKVVGLISGGRRDRRLSFIGISSNTTGLSNKTCLSKPTYMVQNTVYRLFGKYLYVEICFPIREVLKIFSCILH
jgi:hypothetical protein